MSNAELIDKFVEDQKDELKPRTLKNYREYLMIFSIGSDKIRGVNAPFKEASAEDIKAFFRNADLKPNSKEVFKVVVRRFYQWLYHKKRGKYPSQVRELEIHFKNMKRTEPIRPEDILTKEDIAKLISVANSRDQAIVSVLYESAARRLEFLGLNVGHVSFDVHGAVIMVSGKTGDRRIRLIESVPSLQQWLRMHPQKDDPQAPLWVTIEGEPRRLAESTLNIILANLGKRAKINKPMNPHHFRHSRLTETAKFLSDGKMKVFAGWTPDSRMNGIYTHLSGKDLDEDIMKAAGIVQQEKTVESPLKPKACRRCEAINPGPAEYCIRCGLPFDESKLVEPEDTTAIKQKLNELTTAFDIIKSFLTEEQLTKLQLERARNG